MTIGERIKEARKEKNITQAELAIMCGYANKGNISRIEHSGDEVTTKQVRRIAEKLGVTEAYLMGYETLTEVSSIIVTDPTEKEIIRLMRSNNNVFCARLLSYAFLLSNGLNSPSRRKIKRIEYKRPGEKKEGGGVI